MKPRTSRTSALFSDTEPSDSDDNTGSASESSSDDIFLGAGSYATSDEEETSIQEGDVGGNVDDEDGGADERIGETSGLSGSLRVARAIHESRPDEEDTGTDCIQVPQVLLCTACLERAREYRALPASVESWPRVSESESSSVPDSESMAAIHDAETRHGTSLNASVPRRRRRERAVRESKGRKCTAVLAVLDAMDDEGLDINTFLDWAFWGDEECVADQDVRGMRKKFLHGKTAPMLVRRWHTPPRSAHSKKSRPAGGSSFLNDFAVETVLGLVRKEMVELEHINRVDPLARMDRESLTSFSIPEMEGDTRRLAPFCWELLQGIAQTEKQKAVNTKKDPAKIVFFVISILVYSRNHHCSRLQQVLAIYFHFRGLTENGCDTLHALGVARSTRYVSQIVSKMSDDAMREIEEKVESYQSVSSYDNMLVPLRVFSQRVDHKSTPGAGTAATVYIKKDAPPLDFRLDEELRRMRANGMKMPITATQITDLATESYPTIEAKMIDYVLRVLLDSPDFDCASYKYRNDLLLKDSDAGRELPCGPDHVTLQYMLGSMATPQATYEENDAVLAELVRQLSFNTPEKRKDMSLNRILYIVGDQLTVDRIRGLQMQLCDDDNSLERLEFIIAVFGWLHLQMAYLKNIRKQYYGTDSGFGLKSAFSVLGRAGLDKPKTKGTFHEDLEHAMYDVLRTHLRACWLRIGGVSNLRELREKHPATLRVLARMLTQEYAGAKALVNLEDSGDEWRTQTSMFLRDMLQYAVLDHAISPGNVGVMEAMLPHLLFRFIGGRNSNYTKEVLELLQGLHAEWPPAVRDFVRDHCWLVNTSGRRDGFMAIDHAQEIRIKHIKVTHRSQGPSIDWKYLRKLHPVIPVIEAISSHMETEFQTWKRYKRHTSSQDELGIEKLRQVYENESLYDIKAERKIIKNADRAPDVYEIGVDALPKPLRRWVDSRTYTRSTRQDFTTLSGDLDSDIVMRDVDEESSSAASAGSGAE